MTPRVVRESQDEDVQEFAEGGEMRSGHEASYGEEEGVEDRSGVWG